MPNIAVYSATKHAVKGLTEALSIEFRAFGVRAADTLPGLIDTAIIPREAAANAPTEGMFRLTPPSAVAQAVWDAYSSDKLHWYVPPEIEELDKAATLSPEGVREQLAAGGLFNRAILVRPDYNWAPPHFAVAFEPASRLKYDEPASAKSPAHDGSRR